jgi:steroid delta-isomerase
VSAARHADARVAEVVRFFEQLQPPDLARLETLYAEHAHFKDPFNDVTGIAAIRAVFEHMFRTLDAPRFEVRDIVAEGDRAWLTWDMHFRFQRSPEPQCVHGASLLHLDAQGRIMLHRDYWDAAGELYEKLPLIGALMRWLKRRAAG